MLGLFGVPSVAELNLAEFKLLLVACQFFPRGYETVHFIMIEIYEDAALV